MGREPIHTWSNRRVHRCVVAAFTLLLVPIHPGFAAQQVHSPDKLTYIKVLKGSMPEYTQVTVDTDGVGSYQGRKLTDAPMPRPLKLSPATTEALFNLAHALGDFGSVDLESHKNVADLGEKTFIYEHDGQDHKAQFNFTQNRQAQELEGLFEGIAGVEQHLGVLEYSVRYDRLGLPQELTQIEIDLNNNALVDPELLTPMLEKIAANSQFLHIAQIRAEDILRRIQKIEDPPKAGKSRF